MMALFPSGQQETEVENGCFILLSPFLWPLCLPPGCEVDFPCKSLYFRPNSVKNYVGQSYEGAGHLHLQQESCGFPQSGKLPCEGA